MPLTKEGTLTACLIDSNCILVEWEFDNVNMAYENLKKIVSDLPRTVCLEDEKNYWHGLCRSLIFRFPDDLEILKLPEKRIIQVKSASRYGLGDLGVNRARVNKIYKQLLNSNKH